jgi:hypothetical protein
MDPARVGTCLDLVPTERGLALAPAAARRDDVILLDDEVGAILDELAVDAENVACVASACTGVWVQKGRRTRYEAVRRGHVGECGVAKLTLGESVGWTYSTKSGALGTLSLWSCHG